jgi:hypothetical protein
MTWSGLPGYHTSAICVELLFRACRLSCHELSKKSYIKVVLISGLRTDPPPPAAIGGGKVG